MAYAIDIISDSFRKTKELFFPIRLSYWLRMGIANLFGGRSPGGGGGNGGGSSSYKKQVGDLSLREMVTTFNQGALEFLSNYGVFLSLGVFFLYLIGLFFTYIGSVFTFVFIEGIVKKDLKLRKSFVENNSRGMSLFWLRFVVGLISFFIFLVVVSPALFYFFTNSLASFNFLWLMVMVPSFIVYALVFGIFWFLVYDFIVPIMYFKKYAFSSSWKYFVKIASKKKLEIFLYWLMRLVLGIGSGIVIFLLMIPMILVLVLFILLGVGIYLAVSLLSSVLAVILVSLYGTAVLALFIYAICVLTAPISAFFRVYSIEMLKKLEKK
ncbi:hypothetical protein JXC34_01415 [Candidatus Woesearchaeota archaeon]|nr:hypothetical protein [Candidatus Woesearchaeota archaeon]